MSGEINLVLAAVAILLAALLWWCRRFARRDDDAGRCPHCRYDLAGQAAVRRLCPECGEDRYDESGITPDERAWVRAALVFFALVCLAIAGNRLLQHSTKALLARWTLPVRIELMSDRDLLEEAALNDGSPTNPYAHEVLERMDERRVGSRAGERIRARVIEAYTRDADRPWATRYGPLFLACHARFRAWREAGGIGAEEYGRFLRCGSEAYLWLKNTEVDTPGGKIDRVWELELGVVIPLPQMNDWSVSVEPGEVVFDALDMFPYRGDLLDYTVEPRSDATRFGRTVSAGTSQDPLHPTRWVQGPNSTVIRIPLGRVTLSDGANYLVRRDLSLTIHADPGTHTDEAISPFATFPLDELRYVEPWNVRAGSAHAGGMRFFLSEDEIPQRR